MSVAPLFFVGHGSPMFAVGTGEAADNLAKQSKRLDSVQAILVISPHWITHGNVVSTNEQPETVHDFGGFPDCLYRLQYPALGSGYIGHKIIIFLYILLKFCDSVSYSLPYNILNYYARPML